MRPRTALAFRNSLLIPLSERSPFIFSSPPKPSPSPVSVVGAVRERPSAIIAVRTNARRDQDAARCSHLPTPPLQWDGHPARRVRQASLLSSALHTHHSRPNLATT